MGVSPPVRLKVIPVKRLVTHRPTNLFFCLFLREKSSPDLLPAPPILGCFPVFIHLKVTQISKSTLQERLQTSFELLAVPCKVSACALGIIEVSIHLSPISTDRHIFTKERVMGNETFLYDGLYLRVNSSLVNLLQDSRFNYFLFHLHEFRRSKS